jgi:Cft2 family RNA processing exonuclease
MDVRLTPLSGAGTIGGNAYLVSAGSTRVLLDAGIGGRGRPPNAWDLGDLDGVWVSHAHLDHAGALPELLDRDPSLNVYATEATARLAEVALETREDLRSGRGQAAAGAIHTVSPRQWVDIPTSSGPTARLIAFRAGHIPGAALAVVEFRAPDAEPVRVAYTGDFCCHDLPATPGAQLPVPNATFQMDALIMEGVLATDREADAVDVEASLGDIWELAASEHQGCLIPVQTLAESVEMAVGLASAGVSFSVHRFAAPVVEAAARGIEGFDAATLNFVGTREARAVLNAGGCVVAPGDQLGASSPAGRLAPDVVGRAGGLVILLNRAHGRTPAGRLLRIDEGDSVELDGKRLARRGRVEHVSIPTHAPRWQLLRTVSLLEPEHVVLVHGRESQLWALRRALEKDGYTGDITVAEDGVDVHLGVTSS